MSLDYVIEHPRFSSQETSRLIQINSTEDPIMTNQPTNDLANQLISRFGPTMGGHNLYSALGFKTYAAFHRSQQRNELGVHVFKLPSRRGWFAFSGDVARWLEKQSAHQEIESGSDKQPE